MRLAPEVEVHPTVDISVKQRQLQPAQRRQALLQPWRGAFTQKTTTMSGEAMQPRLLLNGIALALMISTFGTQASGLSNQQGSFGKMPDGTPIEKYTLKNSQGVEAVVITYGGVLQSLLVPDKDGKPSGQNGQACFCEPFSPRCSPLHVFSRCPTFRITRPVLYIYVAHLRFLPLLL